MEYFPLNPNRRTFLKSTSLALGACGLSTPGLLFPGTSEAAENVKSALGATDLPQGSAPKPVSTPHFPDRLHAFVWRNWQLVPARRLAEVVGTSAKEIIRLGHGLGLKGPPMITAEQERRSALSVIKRNWHLLPYEQLLQLLGWTAEEMAYTLREDDFLYVKLGNLKPACEPLLYRTPEVATQARAAEIAQLLHTEFPGGVGVPEEPLFDFVRELSQPPRHGAPVRIKGRGESPAANAFSPRYCYSYFALYGDPLLDPALDPYPDGYLARLAASGVDGVWLQGVLTRLAPFPWDPALSKGYETRLRNLKNLVARARRHGVGVYLYLNEPRSCPQSFFAAHPELRGVTEGEYSALCTSVPEVRQHLASAVETICRAAPGLAGFFTISGSENLTNCWSHYQGKTCPRCSLRPAAEVVAELHQTFQDGIHRAGGHQRLIAWDWGWQDDWVESIIARLPPEALFMSVSEWGMPINRGGIATSVGEYSISTVGPGERARRNWKTARDHGLRALAKVQCGNTWELSSVPYIPAVANVARHAANLRRAGVNGLMLGWTLGGYPSPNLEVVAEIGSTTGDVSLPDPETALLRVAQRRVGDELAPHLVQAWQAYSAAFSEFPFHGSLVYNAPMQLGPANPLWGEPTGYHASMVGFPYDDLDGWRAVYPPEVFISQFEKAASGFRAALAILKDAFAKKSKKLSTDQRLTAQRELSVGGAASLHFQSVVQQARFVLARRRLTAAGLAAEVQSACAELEKQLKAELEAARSLHAIQTHDSRIGFEASNQYFYVPQDLAEKVLNCHDLLQRWLPAAREAAMKRVRPH